MKHQVLGTSKSPEAGNSPFCSGNSKRSAVVWEGSREEGEDLRNGLGPRGQAMG